MTKLNTNQDRLKSFDALKLLAIFLVIWGHNFKWFLSIDPIEEPLYRYIYSFHMPLFIMISGFFSLSSMASGVKEFLIKKARRLIYPCIVWGFLLWMVYESTHSFRYGHDILSFGGLLEDYYWFSDFWFLKSCFTCFCLAFFSRRYFKSHWILVSIIASQAISLFYVSFMYPCFVIGMMLKEKKSLWRSISSINYWLIILFVMMLVFWDQDAWRKSHGIPQNLLLSDLWGILEIGFFRSYRLLIGIVGALAFITLFTEIFKRDIHSPLFNLCCEGGKYTLEIYVLHAIVLRIVSPYICLDGMNFFSLNFVVTPVISILILCFCVAVIKVIEHYSILRKYLWGKN